MTATGLLPPERPPALLHNMSARPRTDVVCTVRPLRPTWVSFSIGTTPAPSVADLDAHWAAVGFEGAAVVHPLSADARLPGELEVHPCGDLLLDWNVVLRSRGNVLLAGMPLHDQPGGARGLVIATDEPRLVELVVRR